VPGNDLDPFRKGKMEAILGPSSMKSGSLIRPYSDIAHQGLGHVSEGCVAQACAPKRRPPGGFAVHIILLSMA
jgi:hypothetical protein